MTWIVVGVLVLAVLVGVLSVLSLAGRLRPLMLAVRRLRIRTEQAQGLQQRVAVLQSTVAQVQTRVEATMAAREQSMR